MEDLKNKIEIMDYDILGLYNVVYFDMRIIGSCKEACQEGCYSSCSTGGMCGSCKLRYKAE